MQPEEVILNPTEFVGKYIENTPFVRVLVPVALPRTIIDAPINELLFSFRTLPIILKNWLLLFFKLRSLAETWINTETVCEKEKNNNRIMYTKMKFDSYKSY